MLSFMRFPPSTKSSQCDGSDRIVSLSPSAPIVTRELLRAMALANADVIVAGTACCHRIATSR
jgi:hypothetical protein